ncbi:MAG: helicase-associated domain-containing protein [Fibrobacterota bacterium]
MHKERSFRDYLNALPKASLTALLYGADSRRIVSTTAVVGEVFKKFFETPHLADSFAEMKDLEKEVFRFLLLQGGDGADRDLIQRHVRQASGDKFDESLKQLQNRLFIYGLKSTPFRYFVFREIREALLPLLLAEGLRSLQRTDDAGEERKAGDATFRDTTLFLLFLSRDSLKKTKNGAYNKKQLETMFRFFENKFDVGTAPADVLPAAFQEIVDFLLNREFTEADAEELRITAKGRKWLDQDNAERARSFYGPWLKKGLEDKSRFVLRLLSSSGKPLETDGLAEFVLARAHGDKRPLPGLFGILYDLGLVTLPTHGKHHGGLRISERGMEWLEGKTFSVETSDRITLLPTFEVLAPRTASSQLLKFLFAISHIERSDAVMTFKVGKASLYEGFDRGIRPDTLLKKLEEASAHVVPQNVLFSLREWIDAYGAVSFEMHFILRTKTPELYHKIKCMLSGTAFIREELPPVGFSINAADYEEVFGILTRLGHAPKPFTTVKEGTDGARKPERNILDTYMSERGGDAGNGVEFLLPDEPVEASRSQKHRNGSKYGGKWKILPYHELIHVINYSILMDQGMELELKGGKGIVRLVPKELTLYLSEPKLSGIDFAGGEKVEVNLNDIEKVRVEEK